MAGTSARPFQGDRDRGPLTSCRIRTSPPRTSSATSGARSGAACRRSQRHLWTYQAHGEGCIFGIHAERAPDVDRRGTSQAGHWSSALLSFPIGPTSAEPRTPVRRRRDCLGMARSGEQRPQQASDPQMLAATRPTGMHGSFRSSASTPRSCDVLGCGFGCERGFSARGPRHSSPYDELDVGILPRQTSFGGVRRGAS